MFRKVLMTIGLLLMANIVLAQGTIKGTIIDKKTKEPVPFANVVAKQDGKQIRGTQTDFDGNFTLKPLNVGKYDIEASCVGYNKYVRVELDVKATGFTVCNIDMVASSQTLDEVVIKVDKEPIIEIGAAETSQRLSSEDIAHMPGTSVDAIVAAVGGVGYSDGGTSSVRGEDGMVTMTGGVRKNTGINVPKEAIAEIQVILGGTPASIGEAIGGTQIVTLKPPTSQFKGAVRLDSYLDYRLQNSLMVYLTGPIIRQKIKDENGTVTGDRTFMGFRFTTQGTYQNNGFYRPKGYNYQVVKDEIVRQYEQSPISYDPVTGSVNYAAETGLYADAFTTIKRLTKKDFGGDASRVPNTRYYSVSSQLALTFSFSDYSNLSLTGEFTFQHSPQTGLSPLAMSYCANNVSRYMDWSILAEFTQRFPDEETSANNTEGQSKEGKAIKNIMFGFNVMFDRASSKRYNESFGSSLNDVFKYGYNGYVETSQNPTYELNPSFNYYGTQQSAYVQNNWYSLIDWDTYKPYSANQIYANYNLQLLNTPDIAGMLTNIDDLRYFKGLANGDSPSNIYGLLSNVGYQDKTFNFAQTDYFYGSAKFSADIKGHSLELGFQADIRNSSSYALGASSLWTIMRQNANRHISQMDLSNPHYRWEGSTLYVDYDRLYVPEQQSYFDQAMRDKLGWSGSYSGERTWLDVDRYTPEQYAEAGGLDMFSTDELFNNGNSIVSFSGYDHTGKKYDSKNWSLKDFYSPTNAKYRYLPSFNPIYMGGYIQDQFYFQDLIFNVGVRVDMYDANQWVLKDPYLLYESYTVKDLKNGQAAYNGEIYTGAGDDWTVYVDAADAETPTILGYRNGSVWYDANGVELSSATSLVGKSGKPTPYRTAAGQKALQNNTVGSEAFKDYKTQVVVQPRIAFSFPVGDNSQFKASYDMIARRPSSNWSANYYSYLYMTQISSVSNPNLKPERITNYELGFQQALNESSALSISAYYKETRDLIQLVQYAGADPNSNYYSFDNLDFKTIKGLTVSYDLRKSKNFRVNANYTLQYAEGTGLSSTTMTELIKEGYTSLKMLNPIGDDRRHEFKLNFDFRYLGGAKYNGPTSTRVVKDKETGESRTKTVKILENFGVNVMAVAQSGRPYTRAYSNMQPTIVGSYNGSRLPWSFFFDVVVDKGFNIQVGKRATVLTAALTVTNLFNIRNVKGVFNVTGNAEDNGYLTDAETQSTINAYLDPTSYRDLYAISLRNSTWNYSTPRMFRLTLTYAF